MKVHFRLKEPTSTKDTLIYADFHYRGERIKLSTGSFIHPDLWLGERPRKISNHFELSSLHMKLDNYESAIKDEYYKSLTEPLTPQEFKRRVLDRFQGETSKKEITLYTYMEHLIKAYKGTGKSHKSMQTTMRLLKEYAPELTFQDINMRLYKDLNRYLINKDYTKNYIGRVFANIKIMMNYAMEDGITSNSEFRSGKFKRVSERVYNIYNTVDELVKIYNTDVPAAHGAARAKDLYLVSAFTGLRFQDYSDLKPGNFTDDEYITQDMRKVSGRVIVPLHWIVRDILAKYHGALPVAPCNQIMNRHIKTFGKQAGIKDQIIKTRTQGGKVVRTTYEKWQLMTTHTARRSMATNMYLAGVPILTVSKLLGHSNIKQTIDYIKITELEISQSLSGHPFFASGR